MFMKQFASQKRGIDGSSPSSDEKKLVWALGGTNGESVLYNPFREGLFQDELYVMISIEHIPPSVSGRAGKDPWMTPWRAQLVSVV